jgi:hypothetical protein
LRRVAPLCAALLLCAALGPADEPEVALVPDVNLRLKAARYAPADSDFRWDGWIGAGAGLLRVRATTLYFTADVETIIGNVKRAFDANQANYHLETGLRTRVGRGELTLFFNHVSRHDVDRPKVQAVDWNLLGVRAAAPLPEAFPFAGSFSVSAGHTTLASLVGYQWELTGKLEADVVKRAWGGIYASAEARGVTTRSSPEFPRKGFLDASLEAGTRFTREARALDLFVAYEHRNDVFLEVPGFRDRVLFGFKVGYATPVSSSR